MLFFLFSRTYSSQNLIEDLKVLYRTAGQQGKGITFIFTDQDIKEEGFLEYINNVLSSGVVSLFNMKSQMFPFVVEYCYFSFFFVSVKVAGLFVKDEIDEICNDLIPVMKKEHPKKAPTNENLYEYFMARTRHNLHLVLCFSPVSPYPNEAIWSVEPGTQNPEP